MDIDFVVLWVDGNDPAWQAEKQKYKGAPDGGNGSNRYRDWGLMKYWFRAVETYAPWVRKIHFVTWGHLPPFLDTGNPKLHIVRHEDYMPRDALPCFNSCALEVNLHRIEGLAEHFVYFNDDVFLTRPMKPEQFFDEKTGLPRTRFCEMPCRFQGDLETYSVHLARSVSLINKWFPKKKIPWKRYFTQFMAPCNPLIDNARTLALRLLVPGYFTGLRVFHSYFAYRKNTFETVWEREPELMRKTTQARFRGWEEVNQYILYMWQLVSGAFSPGPMHYLHLNIGIQDIDEICRVIEGRKYDSICLNDPVETLDFDGYCRKLNASFEKILPVQSAFEKQPG